MGWHGVSGISDDARPSGGHGPQGRGPEGGPLHRCPHRPMARARSPQLRGHWLVLRALEMRRRFHNLPQAPRVRDRPRGDWQHCHRRCEADMLDKMTGQLGFHGAALVLRAQRQRTIASNIANADTPGYAARDFKFGDALREVAGTGSGLALRGAGSPAPRHIPLPALPGSASADRQGASGYAVQTAPSLDNSTVDMDRERASFVDNAVRYEATLRFLNGRVKTMLGAIQGQ